MRSPAEGNPASLERDLASLLEKLCVEWGFCLPATDARRIAGMKSVTSKEFAHEVLRAEGMDPEHEVQWVRRIVERFVGHFGSSEVEEGQIVSGRVPHHNAPHTDAPGLSRPLQGKGRASRRRAVKRER